MESTSIHKDAVAGQDAHQPTAAAAFVGGSSPQRLLRSVMAQASSAIASLMRERPDAETAGGGPADEHGAWPPSSSPPLPRQPQPQLRSHHGDAPPSAGSPDEASASPSSPLDLPDLLGLVLSHLGPRDLLLGAAGSCRAWHRAAVADGMWEGLLDPTVAALLRSGELQQHGPPVPARTLYLGVHHCNLLRNPCFQRGHNAGSARVALSKWRRSAWVVSRSGGHGVAWESPPVGMAPGLIEYGHHSSGNTCQALAPPAPEPESGGEQQAQHGQAAGRHMAPLPLSMPLPYPSAPCPSAPSHHHAATAAAPGTDIGGHSAGHDTDHDSAGPSGLAMAFADALSHPAGLGPAAAGLMQSVQAGLSELLPSGIRDLLRPTAQPAPQLPGCIATASEWGEVLQVVHLSEELQQRGLTAAQAELLLDSGLALGLSVLVGARSDGAAYFAVALLLDRDGSDSPPDTQAFVVRPGCHHYFSGIRLVQTPGQWQRVSHLVPRLPVGCRRATVILRGRSKRPCVRPSHGGAKFASCQLVFVPPQQQEAFTETLPQHAEA